MATEITRRLFTVDEYHRMGEAGILWEDDRVELIRGEFHAMSPVGTRHNAAVDRATRAIVRAAADNAIVRVQGSVGLDEYNEPQPDIVLLRPRDDFYASALPGPQDILLIVEIADSSLQFDREIKASVYARTGIPEYWIADLKSDCIFARSEPSGDSDRAMGQFRRGDSIAPQLLPECRLQAGDLLP